MTSIAGGPMTIGRPVGGTGMRLRMSTEIGIFVIITYIANNP